MFSGALDPDSTSFQVLPYGDTVNGITPNEYIFQGADNRFRLLLRSIYLMMQQPSVMPFSDCGSMDMPNDYFEALCVFRDAERMYKKAYENTRNLLKQLGAK